MIKARLYVSGAPNVEGEPEQNDDWGVIGLLTAPSIGDAINLLHDEEFHYLHVERVVHYAIKDPPPPLGRENPSIEVEAAWVSYDLSQYASG